MDALALLCNLHANGPTTMRRLARAGLTRLEQISEVSADELAEILDGPPSHALRFIAEAEQLLRRGAVGILEPEEPLERTEIRAGEPAMEFTNPREMDDVSPATAEVTAEATPEASAGATTEASAGATTEASAGASDETTVRVATPVTSVTSLPADENMLHPGLLEGLDDVLCRKLLGQGVRTLRALHDTAGLSLARRIDLPLTQLLDLKYEAQNALRATLHPPVTTAQRLPTRPRMATERATERGTEQPLSSAFAKNDPAGDAPSVSGPFV